MSEPQPGIRIGHDERAAAMRALDQHLGAGRLDADEYADRTAAVSVARTQADLDVLFTDLPRTQPAAPPSAPPRPRERRLPLYAVPGVLAVLVPLAIIALAITAGAWWLFFLLFAFGCGGGRRWHHYGYNRGYYRRYNRGWAPR